MWLKPLTTASMAHQSANVIMLALMQCILNLIVHNLPSLTVRNNLWLCGVCTSPCASHWHPTTPHVQCILLTIWCSWWTCPRGQRHLGSIPGSFSSITVARCLPDFLSFSPYLQMTDVTFDAGTHSHQNGWLSISTKPKVWTEHICHPIRQVMRLWQDVAHAADNCQHGSPKC